MMRTILASVFLVVAGPASATILTVHANGSGLYPTIQSAVNAAVSGDIVELTNGVYTGIGNRDVDLQGKAITVRSQGGNASLCIIDCEGGAATPHRGFQLAAGSILEGLTVRHGYFLEGSAATAPANATIRGCVFYSNETPNGGWGGALEILGPSWVQDCEFADNHADEGGGAIYADNGVVIESSLFTENTAYEGAAVQAWATTIRNSRFVTNGEPFGSGGAVSLGYGCVVEECYFRANSAETGGAIHLTDGGNTVSGCTVLSNLAQTGGACSAHGEGAATFTNCTFSRNTATYGSVFYADGLAITRVKRCILAFNLGAAPILHNSSYQTLCECTDIYGNEGGDWTPGIAHHLGVDGNICLDPLFCDDPAGDYHLQDASPCAPFNPLNPTCDLAGAWPVGCGPTSIRATSWGRLKQQFR